MMVPVKLQNRHNRSLFGILHNRSPNTHRNVCIVLLSPGIKSRVAPHRLYVKMARRYASMGYTVFRFDFSGLGDSEGQNEEASLTDLYNSIQLGKFVEDTIDVLNWLEHNHGQNRFILAGLCGGAITGLHTGAKDERVIGLLSLGMPVVLEGNAIDKRLFMTPHQLENNRARFLRRALNWNAWLRLISMKSDYKLLYLSFLQPVFKKLHGSKNNGAAASQDVRDNLNPLFHSSFEEFAKSGKLLLMFGESDRLLWDYQEKYLEKYPMRHEKLKKNLEMRIIPEANHILSFQEWTREMLDITEDWLNRHFSLSESNAADASVSTARAKA